ncbi:MAG: adenine deaminase C-terminal domain-containing protein, partial [Phycisphaerales bacterium]
CMFCTDDAHPDDLLRGHIDRMLSHAVARGIDPMVALRAATLHPIRQYGMPCGLLQVADRADLVLVDDLVSFRPRTTWIAGEPVAQDGRSLVPPRTSRTPNAFIARTCVPDEFVVRAPAGSTDGACVTVHAIVASDGEIVTGREDVPAVVRLGAVEPDPAHDLLTIAVVNRYAPAPVAVAMVRGFGLRAGAIASSVAHDCHNVVAVGASPVALAEAVNAVFAARGGLSVARGNGSPADVLPLPIAGLMSDRPADEVAAAYGRLTARARMLGSPLRAPYMTLGFMALLVIPALKLGDRGLFYAERFAFVPAVSA